MPPNVTVNRTPAHVFPFTNVGPAHRLSAKLGGDPKDASEIGRWAIPDRDASVSRRKPLAGAHASILGRTLISVLCVDEAILP